MTLVIPVLHKMLGAIPLLLPEWQYSKIGLSLGISATLSAISPNMMGIAPGV